MGNYVTLVVAITTCFIGVTTSIIAYSQMKIASAKVKLDLYERRFNVYMSALSCYQACHKKDAEEILKCQFELIESCGEAMFLFKEDSGIHEILKQMKSNCDRVYKHEYYRNEYEVISSDDTQTVLKRLDNSQKIVIDSNDVPEFQNLDKIADDARKKFTANLINLEEKIKPYIQFETIQGWTFF